MVSLKAAHRQKRSLILVTPVLLLCALAGARADAQGDYLVHAACKGYLNQVKSFLAKGADVNARDKDGGTALYCASFHGHLEVVQALLAKGADVNGRSNGVTALYAASQQGHLFVVQALLAKGADASAKASDGRTALDAAKGGGHTDALNFSIQSVPKEPVRPSSSPEPVQEASTPPAGRPQVAYVANAQGDEIFRAIKNGDLAEVKALVQENPNLVSSEDYSGTVSWDGSTPLQIAIDRGDLDIVKFLLESKADVNVEDDEGRTPLEKMAGIPTLVFLSHGDSLTAKTTPVAADNDSLRVAELLVAHGANVNVDESRIASAPLLLACSVKNWPLAES